MVSIILFRGSYALLTLTLGAYAVIFLITHWVLVHRQPRGKPINWTMVGISLAMFILATMVSEYTYTLTIV